MRHRNGDNKNFIRLANRRVNCVIKYLRLIGNLSNRSNYYYTPQQLEKIFRAIDESVIEMKDRFKHKERKHFILEL